MRMLGVLAVFLGAALAARAQVEEPWVMDASRPGAFAVVASGHATPIVVSAEDWPGVVRVAGDVAEDVHRVTGQTPAVEHVAMGKGDVILIGTIGHSALIDGLVKRGKLDVSAVQGKWEAAVTTVVERPMPGVGRALVIAGSDKRGTIFAAYELSAQMGVSPWYWWADVRIPHRDQLFAMPGSKVLAEPAVKYRGIFLNDEAPALSGWTREKFGGWNSKFYVHVFELLLRLKANYLWPAMWGSAFNEDDVENPKLADEYGIVMGTSHHEPMLRAQQEWKRHGTGPWDYDQNQAVLDDFWRRGIQRNGNYESTITLGMRGDGDMPMTEGANISLLEKIVADQRKILAENMTPTIAAEPKVWALYKEVQTYYEKGMRVPDDITLLWCDDNWGNIRRLPTAEERKRVGGAGIYYHFDYVGDPRSYKWLNVTSIAKVQEQMHLAWKYGADKIWVVNVGDLKPMEFPISFFLAMAREPAKWDKDRLTQFGTEWAAQQFGPEHAVEIAKMIDDYTRLNQQRKPEQLEPTTYSLRNFGEAERVDSEWRALSNRVDALAAVLPAEERASFFELVQYPADASATVNEMYIAAGRNAYYARSGSAAANSYAAETRRLFARDAELTDEYNHKLMDGRWDHMMDQTHLGYTFWNEPPLNTMPAVTEVQAPEHGTLSVLGARGPGGRGVLGVFDSAAQQTQEMTLVNSGTTALPYKATASADWIVVSPAAGQVAGEQKVSVSVNWSKMPGEGASGTVMVEQQGGGPAMRVPVQAMRIAGTPHGFVESDGYVAIEAADTSSRTGTAVKWEELPGFGEGKSGMSLYPVTAASNLNSDTSLQYGIYLTDTGKFTLECRLAPTWNFTPGHGLRFAVSVDDGPRTVVDAFPSYVDADWTKEVSDGVKTVTVPLTIDDAGAHTLKVWMVDPGVVLERMVLWHGAVRPSYLGPPESPMAQ